MIMLHNGLSYDIHSIANKSAYSAYHLDLPNSEYVKDDTKISSIKTRSTKQSSFENNVYFKEGLRGEYVHIDLSNENLQRLQETFGNASIKKDSEGNVVLKGEAERFVSAWFNDIAYKRGYLKADANNDGVLSLEEKYNTTAFFGNSITQIGNRIVGSDYMTYEKHSAFANANEPIHPNHILNSIEEELNRTLQFDKDMDGRIYVGDMIPSKDILNFFQKIMRHNTGLNALQQKLQPNAWNTPQGLPTAEVSFLFLSQTMKDLRKILEEQLKKHLEQVMQSNTIDPNASAKEIFEKIMSKENGTEILNAIKERLEKQSSPNAKQSVSNSTTQENNTTLFNNKKDENIFNEIAKLTKLDKETLAYNLANNENFEENIISIVEELTQNVDSMYASNTLKLASVLDIRV